MNSVGNMPRTSKRPADRNASLFGTVDDKEQDVTGRNRVKSADEWRK